MTSSSKAQRRFGKQDFRYVAEEGSYILYWRTLKEVEDMERIRIAALLGTDAVL